MARQANAGHILDDKNTDPLANLDEAERDAFFEFTAYQKAVIEKYGYADGVCLLNRNYFYKFKILNLLASRQQSILENDASEFANPQLAAKYNLKTLRDEAGAIELMQLVENEVRSHFRISDYLKQYYIEKIEEIAYSIVVNEDFTGIKKSILSNQIRDLFGDAAMGLFGDEDPNLKLFDDEHEFREFLRELVAPYLPEVEVKSPSIDLPTKAPELYKERDKSLGQKPEDFTLDVYEKYIGQEGFTRALIGDLDPGLYRAYYNHGISDEFRELVPAGQKGAKQKLSAQEVADRKRASSREYARRKAAMK